MSRFLTDEQLESFRGNAENNGYADLIKAANETDIATCEKNFFGFYGDIYAEKIPHSNFPPLPPGYFMATNCKRLEDVGAVFAYNNLCLLELFGERMAERERTFGGSTQSAMEMFLRLPIRIGRRYKSATLFFGEWLLIDLIKNPNLPNAKHDELLEKLNKIKTHQDAYEIMHLCNTDFAIRRENGE